MKLAKVFTEIRFEKALLFDDARTLNSILKELKPLFPVYDNKPEVLAFLNPEQKVQCFVHNDRVIVDFDEPRDFNRFKELSGRVITLVLKKFEVDATQRIGVRAHYHTEDITTEEQSGSAIIRTFFNTSSNEFIQKYGKGELLQPRISFIFKVGNEYFMNVNIGYHVIGEIQVNPLGQQIMSTQRVSPLTDLDFYTTVPKRQNQIEGILRLSCDKIAEYAHMVWK